jgi:hypothetical protein
MKLFCRNNKILSNMLKSVQDLAGLGSIKKPLFSERFISNFYPFST